MDTKQIQPGSKWNASNGCVSRPQLRKIYAI